LEVEMDILFSTINTFVRELKQREVHRALVSGTGVILGTNVTLAAIFDGVASGQLYRYLAMYVLAYGVFEYFFRVERNPFAIRREPPWGMGEPELSPRLQTARRWILAVGISLFIVVGALLLKYTHNVWLYDGRYLVVESFTNTSGDHNIDGYEVAWGVRDALAASTSLSVAPALGVILPTESSLSKRLDARFPVLIAGSIVSDSAHGIAISVNMRDLASGGRRQVYYKRFSSKDRVDPLVVQEEVTHAVMRATEGWIISPRRRQENRTTAERLSLAAREHLNNGSLDELAASIPGYGLAIRMDSSLLQARSGLAIARALRAYYYSDQNDTSSDYSSAVRLADGAIAVAGRSPNDEVGGAYAARGIVDLYRDRKLVEALVVLRTAIQLDRNLIPAYEHLARLYLFEGRLEEAAQTTAAGLRADSGSIPLRVLRGQISYFNGDSMSARVLSSVVNSELCVGVRGVNPHILRAYHTLGKAYLSLGRPAAAAEIFRESELACRETERTPIINPQPCDTVRDATQAALLSRAIAAGGGRDRADQMMGCIKAQFTAGTAPFQIALYYASLSNPTVKDSVFTWLNVAEECRDPDAMVILVEPVLAPFHGEPEFVAIAQHEFDPSRAALARRKPLPPICAKQTGIGPISSPTLPHPVHSRAQ
jgi:tetratricopeptide (TPR) repeat protein